MHATNKVCLRAKKCRYFQHLVVCEGIAAMLALVLLDSARALPTRGPWAPLAHAEKHVLLHDKALAAAPDDGNMIYFLAKCKALSCLCVLYKILCGFFLTVPY